MSRGILQSLFCRWQSSFQCKSCGCGETFLDTTSSCIHGNIPDQRVEPSLRKRSQRRTHRDACEDGAEEMDGRALEATANHPVKLPRHERPD